MDFFYQVIVHLPHFSMGQTGKSREKAGQIWINGNNWVYFCSYLSRDMPWQVGTNRDKKDKYVPRFSLFGCPAIIPQLSPCIYICPGMSHGKVGFYKGTDTTVSSFYNNLRTFVKIDVFRSVSLVFNCDFRK